MKTIPEERVGLVQSGLCHWMTALQAFQPEEMPLKRDKPPLKKKKAVASSIILRVRASACVSRQTAVWTSDLPRHLIQLHKPIPHNQLFLDNYLSS